MDRFIVFLVGIISLSNAHDIDKCMETASFGKDCCKFDVSKDKEAIYKGCLESTGGHQSCDFELCLGKKRGFVMSNGTFNKSALSDAIKEDFQKHNGLGDVLIEKCLSNEPNSRSQKDACYIKAIGDCLRFYALLNCPKWTESDECKKIKSQIEDCKDVVP